MEKGIGKKELLDDEKIIEDLWLVIKNLMKYVWEEKLLKGPVKKY